MNPSRSMHIHTGGGGGTYGQDSGERRPETSSGPSGAAGASWASDAMRYNADRLGEDYPPFFTPSYLKHSRHVQRLRKAWKEHVAELQEHASRNTGMRQPSLSASSSRVNLSKLPADYQRGAVQDVIERLPPPSAANEDRLHPLPSRWSEEDKMNGLEIMADGTEVRFNGVTKSTDEAAAVRSDYPMPKECGIFYFEVTILSRGKDGLIGIGFSGRKANLNRLPGWETDSWAYHGDDGFVFACTASGKQYGPKFASQDVVGCGVNFRTGQAFFTKNGNYLGMAFPNIKGDTLYPSVGMKKPGEHLRINFGKTPFVFDIDSMVEQERRSIISDINKADVSNLHPPDDENALIYNLVGQYLAHEGYVETARAFTRDVQERQIPGQSQTYQLTSEDDDIHAINRQKIRKSILDGDIDRALKYTSTYYPRLFQDGRNKDIYFRLRCRKFIEMMRRYTELGTAASSPTTVTKSVESLGSNGHADAAEEQEEPDEPPDTQMELDDQIQRETSKSLEPPSATAAADDVDMDASQELSPKITFMKADQLLSEAVKYGQELREEFGRDPRPGVQKQLQDIFAIVAYQNVSVSPIGHLFDARGRGEIAEEVNGAVLVSLGKPSSAALEKVCAQTETLLDETANKTGGAAAFINVRQDFLQPEQSLSFKTTFES
ncbi:hypothetical protein M409DRAFT_20537 [Zasmidium cellare ATCC 36951]|uniref:Uncharacterized protein n=1 Tax=Zasmidium cellare ATCC 36951 TaxID=1080233 RepID=A0A6A6CQG6_ZASCE|nr:uncharacterized protein M409DRAFT_20537 [Zasmidium cellare ATCC 36951]KAF2169311.1 hypothetical protein M409DRAFT_20537 [Zasmidium cellare ATCC 36951]